MSSGRKCIFCGSDGPLTKEHVLGNWLADVGLSDELVENMAGPLNRIGTSFGTARPFQITVKSVCASCNNGWMSRLEQTARRVLAPKILGEHGRIQRDDAGAIASWIHKTALVAMYLSSDDARREGYGLPPEEYSRLYQASERIRPLAESTYWIGRYTGEIRSGSVRVTPMILRDPERASSKVPDAYAMTIVLGALVLQGLRFTAPDVHLHPKTSRGLPQLWPPQGHGTDWPGGREIGDEDFLRFSTGKEFELSVSDRKLLPWAPAVDLEESQLIGGAVALPTMCGEHVAHYPAAIAEMGIGGRFFAFVVDCDCPRSYLIETQLNGAHCKSEGTADFIEGQFNAIPGAEINLNFPTGRFRCKRLDKRNAGSASRSRGTT
jgi:hypothetical protein